MKIYTIIGGVNGCGKSSLTGSLKAERTDLGIIIDPDKIAAEFGGDVYEGGKAAVDRLEKALEDGLSFTQETTLSLPPQIGPQSPRGGVLHPTVLHRAGQRRRKPAPHRQPGAQGRPRHPTEGRGEPLFPPLCGRGQDPALLR